MQDCARGNTPVGGVVFAKSDLGVRHRESTPKHRVFSAADHSLPTRCIMFASDRLIKRALG
jgi:hypothetical protein